MKDYYKILGVEEEASEEEIRARWIELTKYYHPDLRKTEEGDEKIKEINEAYEILKDEPTRFQYDFERDLKRSFIKKAHRRQERETSIRKIIMIPSGVVVLFLIVGFILLRSGRVATPPGPMVKTEVLHEGDKGSEKMTASRTPPVKIGSKAQSEGKAPMEIKEVVIPPESEREVIPPESTEMVSFRPPQSPSEVERESEQNKEPAGKILPEEKVPAGVGNEAPAKRELESEGKLTPQVVMKPEMPATMAVPKEVPKETPKPVAKEIPKEVAKEAPNQVAKEIPKDIPREAPKEAPKEVAKEIPKEVRKETPKQVAREVSKEVLSEVPKEVPPKEVSKEIVKEVSKEAPKEVPREVSREVPKEVTKEVVREIPKEVPKEIPKQIVKEIPREVPKEPPKEVPKGVVKEVPKERPKEVSIVTLHPGEHLTMWTKGGKVVSSRTSLLAKEEEVKQFFSNYVDRYHRKDVDEFLSCFSSRAIQNQTDRSEAIRNFYTKFFNQSRDLRYQIEGMKIEISQYRVEVKARFRVDQKLKKDGEEKVWKGNIRWVLVKEEGRLKIISLDY
jgi:curved DNA-binding protein CbpA